VISEGCKYGCGSGEIGTWDNLKYIGYANPRSGTQNKNKQKEKHNCMAVTVSWFLGFLIN
jgi:hypothetical protein